MWNQCRYRIACLSADIFIIFVSLSQLFLLGLFGWSRANLHNNDFTWKIPYLQGFEIVCCRVLGCLFALLKQPYHVVKAFVARFAICLYELIEFMGKTCLLILSGPLKGKIESKEDVVRCFKLILEWTGPYVWMAFVMVPLSRKGAVCDGICDHTFVIDYVQIQKNLLGLCFRWSFTLCY